EARPRRQTLKYTPPPPAVYPAGEPQGYNRGPLPPLESGTEVTEPPGGHYGRPPSTYRDANGVRGGSYDPRYDEQAPPRGPQYGAPTSHPVPQPLPAVGADAVP